MNKLKTILLWLAVATAFSCSEPSLEDKARGHFKPLLELMAKDPTSIIIQDVKTELANDSICVLSFLFKGKNSFGGYEAERMEYILIRLKDKKTGEYEYWEHAYPVTGEGSTGSILDTSDLPVYDEDISEEKRRSFESHMIFGSAIMKCKFNGRKLED